MSIATISKPVNVFSQEINSDRYSYEDETLGNRTWSVFYQNDKVLTLDSQIQIVVKTRNDEPTTVIPNRMFSSLKYEFEFQVIPGFLNSTIKPILLGKLQVIDAETNEEIIKNDKPVLKGVTEGCLTTDENSILKMKLKLQFGEMSHGEKKDCRFQLCLYTPSDLFCPVLVLKSSSFKVYARRSGYVEKKSKRSREETNITNKKPKSSLTDYMKNLEELVKFKDMLPEKERKLAEELLAEKLGEKDEKLENLFDNFEKETKFEFASKEFDDLFTLVD